MLCLNSQELDRFPGGDAQDDSRPLDLVPREGTTPDDLLQDRSIMGNNPQGARFSTTHKATPVAEPQY